MYLVLGNIFLELFHFGTAELICQNKVLGVVGGVLGWNTIGYFCKYRSALLYSYLPNWHPSSNGSWKNFCPVILMTNDVANIHSTIQHI